MTWAFAQRVESGAKFLLVALADSADPYGVTYAGQALFVDKCNITRETVSRRMAVLREAGLIATVQRRRGNGSRTSDYTVLAPRHADRAPMKDAPEEEFPESVLGLACQCDDSSRDDPSCDDQAPGHVTISGGPEPSVEPSAKKTSSSSSQRSALEREDVDRLCGLLAALIQQRDPKAKLNPASETWRDPMRLLLDRDGRSIDEVERVIRWCQADDFEHSNVLSPGKLRKRFTQLLAKANRDVQQPSDGRRGRRAAGTVPNVIESCPGRPVDAAAGRWAAVKEQLLAGADPDVRTWLSLVHAHRFEGEVLVLACPIKVHATIKEDFGQAIAEAVGGRVALHGCSSVSIGDGDLHVLSSRRRSARTEATG